MIPHTLIRLEVMTCIRKGTNFKLGEVIRGEILIRERVTWGFVAGYMTIGHNAPGPM